MSHINIGDRVQWTGQRGAQRQGTVISIHSSCRATGRGGFHPWAVWAEIRTSKGNWIAINVAGLELVAAATPPAGTLCGRAELRRRGLHCGTDSVGACT